eukprot:TRINITY_DN2518_c0_g2_i9.p1 TRINITY_DN2518_c0_g2~~TRINITY_DN2518_c0_g2_i9.p1  ORF type:complete len:526 (-),score=134.40 TRINITY_DN2518_c0_g2_i9:685-2262(-)
MKKSLKMKTHIETTHDLLLAINSGLSKLNSPSTIASGLKELKEIMQMHVTNNSRMCTLITVLSEQNEHMTLYHKKEITKVYGLMGEVFTESLIPFFTKIIASFKTRWDDPSLHVALSDSFGVMVHHVFRQREDQSEAFRSLLKSLLEAVKDARQEAQIGAAMCLGRALQNGPPASLPLLLPDLVDELVVLFKTPGMKCLGQLFEILINTTLAIDKKFEGYAPKFIPIIIENMNPKEEWSVKKLAIDAAYTLAAIVPKVLEEQSAEIAGLLRTAKTDKSRHVRNAAHAALLKLKEKDGAKRWQYESMRRAEESGKSILNVPINPKFMRAAPKKTIEIHTVVPTKHLSDKTFEHNPLAEDSKENMNELRKREDKAHAQSIDIKTQLDDNCSKEELHSEESLERREEHSPGEKVEAVSGDEESQIESSSKNGWQEETEQEEKSPNEDKETSVLRLNDQSTHSKEDNAERDESSNKDDEEVKYTKEASEEKKSKDVREVDAEDTNGMQLMINKIAKVLFTVRNSNKCSL